MTGQPPSLADWLQMVSLAVGCWASGCSLLYLTYDAALVDFDPRPAVRLAVAVVRRVGRSSVDGVRLVVWDVSRSEAVYPLLRSWDNAPHAARRTAANCAVALLLLVAPHTPEAHR
ncbi:MAG TPA: hypothetical protein VI172_04550 [Candidatus Dormibacteraeota bacterium]|jgi:hypothetical protein